MWLDTNTWAPWVLELTEKLDDLGPRERIEPVQRLIENQHLGLVTQGLSELDPLTHALRVSFDCTIRRICQLDALERERRQGLRLTYRVSVYPEIAGNERASGDPGREGIVLRAITHAPKHRFRLIELHPKHRHAAA